MRREADLGELEPAPRRRRPRRRQRDRARRRRPRRRALEAPDRDAVDVRARRPARRPATSGACAPRIDELPDPAVPRGVHARGHVDGDQVAEVQPADRIDPAGREHDQVARLVAPRARPARPRPRRRRRGPRSRRGGSATVSHSATSDQQDRRDRSEDRRRPRNAHEPTLMSARAASVRSAVRDRARRLRRARVGADSASSRRRRSSSSRPTRGCTATSTSSRRSSTPTGRSSRPSSSPTAREVAGRRMVTQPDVSHADRRARPDRADQAVDAASPGTCRSRRCRAADAAVGADLRARRQRRHPDRCSSPR